MEAPADDEPPRRVVANFPHMRGGVSEVVMPRLDLLCAAAPGGPGDGARGPRKPKRKKPTATPEGLAPPRKKCAKDLAPQQQKAIAAMREKMAERPERLAPREEGARPRGGAQDSPLRPEAADWHETLEGICFAGPAAASSGLNSSGFQNAGAPGAARAEEFDARALEQVEELDAFLQAEFARTAEPLKTCDACKKALEACCFFCDAGCVHCERCMQEAMSRDRCCVQKTHRVARHKKTFFRCVGELMLKVFPS